MVKLSTLLFHVFSFQRIQPFLLEQGIEHYPTESPETNVSTSAHTSYLEKSIKLI